MKTRLTVMLFLVMVFPLTAELLFPLIPVASSFDSVVPGSVSMTSSTVPVDVGATMNFATSINITGNIVVAGNNVTSISGLSYSARARVFLDGSIIVRDNGTLILRYVTLYLMGSKRDYDRYIRLSNPSPDGHPRLIVLNATIIAFGYAAATKLSFGSVIDVRDNSEVTGKELSFSRAFFKNIGKPNPAVLNCSGDSSVNLSYLFVESIRTYNNARVSVSMGSGPINPSTKKRESFIFNATGLSVVKFYGVNFTSSSVSGNASLSLAWSTQLAATTLSVKNWARVNVTAASNLVGSLARNGIEAMGNSRVAISNSTMKGSIKTAGIILMRDNATVSVNNCTLFGKIVARGYSVLYMSNMSKPTAYQQARIELRNFAKGYFFKCLLSSAATGADVAVYDSAFLSFVSSSMEYGFARFYQTSSVYFSNSSVKMSQVFVEDSSNFTLADGSFVGNSLEMRKNSSLRVESSSRVASLFVVGTARVSLVTAYVSMVQLKDDSKLLAFDSVVKELLFTGVNVTGSWGGLTNFVVNSSLTLGGRSPDLVLVNTFVDVVDVMFLGYSNVTISNSTLRTINLQGSSVLSLFNTSFVLDAVNVLGDARLRVWSVVRVRTVDFFGSPLSGTNVTVLGGVTPFSPTVASKLSGADGWVSFLLFSELFNSTGRFATGGVQVYGRYNVSNSLVSARKNIVLSALPMDVVMSLPLPSWSVYIIPSVMFVAVIVLLAVVSFLYRRIRKRQA